ncbi:ABC transporter substrate binding protein [Candidatus Bealeia paramacronuclearis]|uniref:ABC transporter substrate binding protein n=1 Tax=Candidatus Bealeia paramacronuclearis TaxID=1921001 RepID=A0ABZ2C4G4_9PROT|nr:ABC transporter substrate binding protein [Candidatus Bealeia paramacronuclearis]
MFHTFTLKALACTTLFSLSLNATPLVTIANYGPHASLEKTIQGFREELAIQGFEDGKTIQIMESNVNFDQALIPQMLTKLQAQKPAVMLVMTTPVAEAAKHKIKTTPLVFADITDPVAAGLIPSSDQANSNISGASEKQDLTALLAFAERLLPNAKRVGILYATGEDNDKALLKMMEEATKAKDLELVAIGVDHARNVPMLMQKFKGKVDFIYVGTSGPIQPSLPAISSEAVRLHIPVINADSDAVKNNLVLASFGVSYEKIGQNAGKIAAQVLKGTEISKISPLNPRPQDHEGFISLKVLNDLKLELPKDLSQITVIK